MNVFPEVAAAIDGDAVADWFADASGTLARIAVIVVVAVVVRWLICGGIRRSAERASRSLDDRVPGPPDSRRAGRIEGVAMMLTSITSWVLFAIAVLLVLGEVGVNLGPLLAGAGVVGIAVAFGAQTLVRDVLAGFSVMLEDQYSVGDQIVAGAATGTVERVTLRSTQIRDVDGTIWHVPNGAIESVGNRSQASSTARVDIGVAHEADLAGARAILAAAAAELVAEQEWADGPIVGDPQDLGVAAITPTGVTLRVEVRTRPEDRWRVERALRERLAVALREGGVPLEVHHREPWGT